MRVLNLYAGIGGNRKLWANCEVTAVEYNESVANVYRHYFPNDNVVVGDAHEYLLAHYKEFDFIWTSRPCITHSRANFWASKTADNRKKYYPDMTLYQEIIFLDNWFEGDWVAENVVPYYPPLIQPDVKLGRHLFWSNFKIDPIKVEDANIPMGKCEDWSYFSGFDLSQFKLDVRKDQVYRNCVNPETGLHIFNCMKNKNYQPVQKMLFEGL
ncbi:DNA cytosine methyltransferase [Niabella sp. CJ426]|uniref:DNA cytosine methyltransferase n=1 Tax=Niabella sp. CJ426 TaxID=3393740 RepID=UPI003D0861C6